MAENSMRLLRASLSNFVPATPVFSGDDMAAAPQQHAFISTPAAAAASFDAERRYRISKMRTLKVGSCCYRVCRGR